MSTATTRTSTSVGRSSSSSSTMDVVMYNKYVLLVVATIIIILGSSTSSSSPFVSAEAQTNKEEEETTIELKDCSATTDDDSTCSSSSLLSRPPPNIGRSSSNSNIECNVYMAPSTVGNASNLGIYTAASMKNGDVVPYAEIIIPFLWRIFGVHPQHSLTDGELWDRYIWEQHVGTIEAFDNLNRSVEKASCFIPGVGCTVNSMLDLSNIYSASGSQYDDVVDRSSPGAGAFSPYHSSATTISDPRGVEPGQELFASYGYEWIPWIPNVAVTRDEYFLQADSLMDDFEEWIVQHEEQQQQNNEGDSVTTEVTDELLEAMWKFMVNFPFPHQARPLSVLPKEWSRERSQRKKTLAASMSDDHSNNMIEQSSSKDYWARRGKVSIEFLKEHGKCQDHIRPGISTLPHAGRGAFATRDLPKGTVVGYAPLVHVAIRGDDIFQVTYDTPPSSASTKGKKDDNRNYTRPDLIVNYSFGHKNSTLYLTPYGAMVNYINHQSTNDTTHGGGGGGGANVRIQWPTHELVAHKPDWLTKDIYFLRDTVDKIGLSFEYVALRDIKEGEEVFMDYGDEWVKAWEEHVANWVPPDDADGYVHSSKFVVDYLRTPEELETDPYPWNIHTLCVDSYEKDPQTDRYTHRKSVGKNSARVHCRVLERHEVPFYLYTVEMTIPDKTGSDKEQVIVVHEVPRNDGGGINLYDKAYSQSWHLEHAFRHKMYIPDDMMPKSWMNRIE